MSDTATAEQEQDTQADTGTDGAAAETEGESGGSDAPALNFDQDQDELLHQDLIDNMGSPDDLKHVLRVQRDDPHKTPWEDENQGNYRNGSDRSDHDFQMSDQPWTRADVAYARQKEANGVAQNNRPNRRHVGGVNRGGVAVEGSFTAGGGQRETQTRRTDVRGGTTTTDTETSTTHRGRGSRDADPHTYQRSREVNDGDTTHTRTQGITRDTNGVTRSDEQESSRNERTDRRPNVNTGSDIATVGERASAAAISYSREFDVGAGFKFKVTFNLAAVSADVAAGVGASGSGASADAGAAVKANLGDFKLEGMWSPGYIPFLGEEAKPTYYMAIEGKCGAEAAVQAEATAGSVASSADGANPDMDRAFGLGAGAGGAAFAGAQLSVAAGYRLDWKKKDQSLYEEQLGKTGEHLVSLLSYLGGVPGRVAGYFLNIMGTGELVGEILKHVVTWGAPGDSTLLMVEGKGTGSAGAGISGQVSAGYQEGTLSFQANGGITVGVGGAATVNVGLDIIQGPLFMMIAAGQLTGELEAWALDKLRAAWANGIELSDAFWEWFDGDDKAIEAVDAGTHKAVSPRERAKMVDKILDWVVGDDSESAIVEILNYSDNNGDLVAVSSAMDSTWVDVISAIDGEEYSNLCHWVHDKVHWCVTVGKLRYPYSDVIHDGSEPPYVYFDGEYNCDESESTGDFDREESSSRNPNYNYYLQMNDLTTDIVARFWSTSCEASHYLKAEFYKIHQAYEYRYGSHGIFPKEKQ